MPWLMRHSFTHRSDSIMYLRSSCGLTGYRPFSRNTHSSLPTET